MAGEHDALPYGFDLWHPLLRGASLHSDVMTPAQAGELSEPVLRPGESQLVVGKGVGRKSTMRGTMAPAWARGAGHVCERFAAFPNTGGGFVLLPADDRHAYRSGLTMLPAGRRRWRAARQVLSWAGAIGWTTPPGSTPVTVITRTPRIATSIPECLAGKLAAVASGVPGLHQKLALRLLATGPQPERVVKIATSAPSRIQVEREADALRRVAEGCDELLAPRLIAAGEQGGHAYLVQEALGGRRSANRFGPEHARFLGALRGRGVPRSLASSLRYRRDGEELARLAPGADSEWRCGFVALRAALERFWTNRQLVCGRAHGDFTPWNLLEEGGRLRAFDWEYFADEAPALHDLFHFVTQTSVLVRRMDVRGMEEQVERALDVADEYLPESCSDRRDAPGLFGLYLLHAAVADEALHRIERPPFEQVDWLRNARIELAASLAARLERAAGSTIAVERRAA